MWKNRATWLDAFPVSGLDSTKVDHGLSLPGQPRIHGTVADSRSTLRIDWQRVSEFQQRPTLLTTGA